MLIIPFCTIVLCIIAEKWIIKKKFLNLYPPVIKGLTSIRRFVKIYHQDHTHPNAISHTSNCHITHIQLPYHTHPTAISHTSNCHITHIQLPYHTHIQLYVNARRSQTEENICDTGCMTRQWVTLADTMTHEPRPRERTRPHYCMLNEMLRGRLLGTLG